MRSGSGGSGTNDNRSPRLYSKLPLLCTAYVGRGCLPGGLEETSAGEKERGAGDAKVGAIDVEESWSSVQRRGRGVRGTGVDAGVVQRERSVTRAEQGGGGGWVVPPSLSFGSSALPPCLVPA